MSYCVNCGVELDASAKKCALCSTPVINPNFTKISDEEKPFAEQNHLPKGVKRRFVAFVISVAMLIPNIVMLFLNIFFIRHGFWSIYVASTCLLLWVVFVLPFFTKKIRPYLMWAFDTLAVAGFFYVIFHLHTEVLYLLNSFLCVTAIVSIAVLCSIIWGSRKKRHWTSVTVFLFLEFTLVAILSGIAVALLLKNFTFFVIAIVIAVCSFVMMLFFIYCNKSKYIRDWLNKAFYL